MPNLSRLIFFYLVALQVTLASECCINITVVINTTVFSDEIGWETIPKSDAFSNQIYSDFSLYKHEHCLPPNTEFTFLAKDSFGDGWEGATYTVFVNGSKVLGATTFTSGYFFANEKFTTCGCSCSLNCEIRHRHCCVNETECGNCFSGYILGENGMCDKIELNPSELEAWQMLFNSTNGRNWKECYSVLSYHRPCNYCKRVKCNLEENYYTITDLLLQDNYLVGTIPASINKFVNLYALYLNLNFLNGSVPLEISSIKKLEWLRLEYNNFNGAIMTTVSQLLNLKHLSINSNQFKGTIPKDISNLKFLRTLILDFNLFHGTIPGEISQLDSLITLSLASNQLSGRIPELSSLFRIVWLELQDNDLTGLIPASLFQLPLLTRLVLKENNLIGTISPTIFGLGNLRTLDLGRNRISGTIPIELYQLVKLQVLYLNDNQLSGEISEKISRLVNLRWLRLNSNRLTGSILDHIVSFREIRHLHLDSNSFAGTIPLEFKTLSHLESLRLHSNHFNGTIPLEIAELENLQELTFSENKFYGTIPSTLGLLSQLKLLDISSNEFVGTIPVEWSEKSVILPNMNAKRNLVSHYFQELKFFKACCNRLSGYLVDFINPFLSIAHLTQLDLSNNHISGTFDFWPEKWFEYISGATYKGFSSLFHMDLSYNKIEGFHPSDLPISLSVFFISQNYLIGTIPDSYSQLHIFKSQNNLLRSHTFPSFLKPNDQWSDLDRYDTQGVECQGFTTNDGSAKIFDIQPVYDKFRRCKCKPGYYNFQSNSSTTNPFVKCEETPPGFYTSERNRDIQPTPCPIGQYSSQTRSTRCDICAPNTFSLGGQSKCHPCPTKAECVNGVIGLIENTWIHSLRVMNETTTNEHIHNCLNNEACIVNGSNVRCAWEVGYDNSSVLCSECLDGFYSTNRMTKTCEECTGAAAVISLVLAVILILVAIVFIIRKLVKTHKIAQLSRPKRASVVELQSESDKKGLLRILVGHIQVLTILSSLQLRGPNFFHMAISSSVGSFTTSLSPATIKCALNVDFGTSVIIAALTPVIIIVLLVIIVTIISFVLKSSLKTSIISIYTVFVFVFYLVHPQVMKQLLEVFHIHEQEIEGELHLQSDMFIIESSSKYSTLFVVALLGVCIYGVVMTIGGAIVLQLEAKKTDKLGRIRLANPMFEENFGFLYQGYRLDGFLYLWELLIYFRKSCLLFLGVFFGYDSFLQSYLASVVLIGALALHSKFQPYRSDRMNRVESRSLGVLGVTQMCLMLSSHYRFSEVGNNWAVSISVVLLVMNGWFIVTALMLILKGVRGEFNIGQHIHPITNINKKNSESWSNLIEHGDEFMNILQGMSENAELKDLEELLIRSCIFVVELEKKLEENIGEYCAQEELFEEKQTQVNEKIQGDYEDEKEESVFIHVKEIGYKLYELWKKLKRFRNQVGLNKRDNECKTIKSVESRIVGPTNTLNNEKNLIKVDYGESKN